MCLQTMTLPSVLPNTSLSLVVGTEIKGKKNLKEIGLENRVEPTVNKP